MLLFSCSQVFCRYIYDTVGIDIKGNLDLRNASSCWRNSIQTELAEGFVVFRELTLTLYYVDIYCCLVISCGGEDLAFLGRDCGVTLDQTSCNTSHRLDGQRQRSYIQKKDVACAGISCKFTALYGSTKCYALIRVQALARLVSSQLSYFILYSRDTGRSAYQKDFGKLGCLQACIRECSLYRLCGFLYQVVGQLIEFSLCQVHIEMFRAICGCSDERQVDVGCSCAGKLFLCFLCCFSDSLQCHFIVGKINTFLFLELSKDIICYFLVEVIAAQTVVSCCGKNFDNTVTDLDDGNIEGTASKVVYHDLLLFLVIQSVCQSCCGRLVDDTFYIKTCDFTGIFGCLTLCVIKVSRNCDNCFCYFLTKVVLCITFQFLKDHSGDLLRRVFLSFDVYFIISTHLTFDGTDGSVCVCYSLTFCRLADQTFTCFCECYDRWSCSFTLCVCDNGWFSTFHNGYTAVCCS